MRYAASNDRVYVPTVQNQNARVPSRQLRTRLPRCPPGSLRLPGYLIGTYLAVCRLPEYPPDSPDPNGMIPCKYCKIRLFLCPIPLTTVVSHATLPSNPPYVFHVRMHKRSQQRCLAPRPPVRRLLW